jgi:hypothetical protein
MIKIIACMLILAQTEQETTIHLRLGGTLTGQLVQVQMDGVKLRGMSGKVYLIPVDDLSLDWQARCRQSKHSSMDGLAGSMGQL